MNALHQTMPLNVCLNGFTRTIIRPRNHEIHILNLSRDLRESINQIIQAFFEMQAAQE